MCSLRSADGARPCRAVAQPGRVLGDRALPHRLRHRRGARADHRHGAGVGELGDDRARGRPRVRLRLLADDACRCCGRGSPSAPPCRSRSRRTRCRSRSWRSSTTRSCSRSRARWRPGSTACRFWGSLAVALLVAGAAAYPVNRWLIARGRGPRGRARAPRALRNLLARAHGPLSRGRFPGCGQRPRRCGWRRHARSTSGRSSSSRRRCSRRPRCGRRRRSRGAAAPRPRAAPRAARPRRSSCRTPSRRPARTARSATAPAGNGDDGSGGGSSGDSGSTARDSVRLTRPYGAARDGGPRRPSRSVPWRSRRLTGRHACTCVCGTVRGPRSCSATGRAAA